jgi:hypothetical protein
MNVDEIRQIQAQWILGILSPESMVQFACQALEADIDSPSLCQLAGEIKPTHWTVQPLFERIISELGLELLSKDQANLIVARNWAKKIVSGEVSPYDGAKGIWRECCHTLRSGDRFVIISCSASEYEDLQLVRPGSPEHYDRLIRICEDDILEEAKILLEESAPK